MQPIEPQGEEKESAEVVKVQTLIHNSGILYVFISIINNFYVHLSFEISCHTSKYTLKQSNRALSIKTTTWIKHKLKWALLLKKVRGLPLTTFPMFPKVHGS